MPSPFPGMDPYLEGPAAWSDFHQTFNGCWREAVLAALPDHYDARINERVNLVEVPQEKLRRRIGPDVVVEKVAPTGTGGIVAAPAGAAVLEPITLGTTVEDDVSETYIEILHQPDRTLVAVLELLSPSNKEEPGRREHLHKRIALLKHEVHLVELDLVLKGRRLAVDGDLPDDDYFCFVTRGDGQFQSAVYHWSLRQPLPAIPIPLLPPDPDIWVDLAAVFRTTYQRGRYDRVVKYDRPPPISLPTDKRIWVEEQARQASR